MAAEMHSSFPGLRRKHSMNIRRVFAAQRPDDDVLAELRRIMELWAQARARFGGRGPFLFGDFGAADMMFAPRRYADRHLPAAGRAFHRSLHGCRSPTSLHAGLDRVGAGGGMDYRTV